jgi:hypothetical protein
MVFNVVNNNHKPLKNNLLLSKENLKKNWCIHRILLIHRKRKTLFLNLDCFVAQKTTLYKKIQQ